MKRTLNILFVGLLGLIIVGAISGCEKGPAEKAGQKIDEAVTDTKDAVKDAGDKLDRK